MNRNSQLAHVITPDLARTLSGLLVERAQRTPRGEAYRHFDAESATWHSATWAETYREVARWRAALAQENLGARDTVGIMLGNSREWVHMEQAALSLGLVVVPLFTNDRAENVAYILEDARIKVLILGGEDHLSQLLPIRETLATLPRVLCVAAIRPPNAPDNLRCIDHWLPADAPRFTPFPSQPDDLATIVYTSGTTGKPKGVMLSHRNILSNAYAGVLLIPIFPNDVFLSFLPLSHMLERTLGYYIPMMTGATVAFARSVPQLGEDLTAVHPTVMISVPRIYERVYARIQEQLGTRPPLARRMFEAAVNIGWARFQFQQGRAAWSPSLLLWSLLRLLVARKIMQKLGGRVRVAIAGGAALSPQIARTFIGLGLPLIQGYGLTEFSPIISGNKLHDNIPESVGLPLDGVSIRVANNGELLAKGASVMLGYWNNHEATRALIDADGWLHTGDQVRVESGHIFITGRLKEIIVLANGEKIAPNDMEQAIASDPLFEQVMVIGEGKPFLSALLSLNHEHWQKLAADFGVSAADPAVRTGKPIVDELLRRIAARTGAFPGYAQIRRVAVTNEAWTIDNGLITPTLKLRRSRILAHFPNEVQQLYAGH